MLQPFNLCWRTQGASGRVICSVVERTDGRNQALCATSNLYGDCGTTSGVLNGWTDCRSSAHG